MRHFLFILLLVSNIIIYAQTSQQREVIKSSISKVDSIKNTTVVENYTKEKINRIKEFLKKHPYTPKSYIKNKKLYVLYDISKNGKPLYITIKKSKKKNINFNQ